METELTRDPKRTRVAILTETERLISTRGLGFSLADVAAAAAVSKSGLLHHFPSRDALLRSVTEHGMTAFIDDVMRHVEPGDDHPGAILRAYVRALTGGSGRAMALFSPGSHTNGLIAVPGVQELFAQDAQYWRDTFLHDGLPASVILIVRHAAEGAAAAAAVSSYLTSTEQRVTREALLALTRQHPGSATSEPVD